MTKCTRSVLFGSLLALAAGPDAFAETTAEAQQRLSLSATTLAEIMAAPDKGIPESLLEDAHCAVIVPGLKQGAFIVGAKYGKGFLTCRAANRNWSAPAAIRIEGGGVGFQIGGSETDVVMLVMNQHGADRLMSSEFTLGGAGEVAAGPVGRSATAKTDAKFTAEILSWSRTRGLFAGVSLEGATLRADPEVNELLYGSRLDTKDVVRGTVKPPAAATELLSILSRHSPHEK